MTARPPEITISIRPKMTKIHNTAVIGKDVRIGSNVEIAPYAVIDGKAEIGDNTIIGPFVHITGWVKIGRGNKIFSAAAIGEPPQDISWDGQPGLVELGDGNTLREYVTVHTPIHGSEGDKTVLGNNCFLMANSHVGHNTKLSDGVILANGCVLAGFVEVGENAFLSGNVAVHQFCRIGAYVMVGGLTKVVQDVPHYALVAGNPAETHGLNIVGLKRKGFNQEQRTLLKEAYRIIHSGKPKQEILSEIGNKFKDQDFILRLADFLKDSKRGIVKCHAE
jgi:UDP-N-acetylglucosamine acyltransferase